VALTFVAGAYILFVMRLLPTLFFSAAITLFVGALVLRAGAIRNVLAHPILVLLGKRSYAMYLVHVLALNAAAVVARKMHVDHWFTVMPLTYAGSFAFATLLYYGIEKPCIERGRSLSKAFRNRLSESRHESTHAHGRVTQIENPVDAV
jgi:peptidoglycan/LPS O-acetylase OafA/YrhL